MVTVIVPVAAHVTLFCGLFYQTQRAIDRQRLMPVFGASDAPAFGYGANSRPLWDVRAKDAEQIRIILRDAGCWEFGYHRGGFVVEDHGQGSLFSLPAPRMTKRHRVTALRDALEQDWGDPPIPGGS
jgi:hypothetical protein